MDMFYDALLTEKENAIPEEDDWFVPLIGDWTFDYYDSNGRQLKGEWLFRKVLEGSAVEDIFICPSRGTRESNPQPDSEYGVAVRMYNFRRHCYNMTYMCAKYTTHLEVHNVDGNIECTVLDDKSNRWIFSEITENSFHWQNVTVLSDGEHITNCEVFARRCHEVEPILS